MLARPIERVTRHVIQGQPLQAHPLLAQSREVGGLDLQTGIETLEREPEPLGLAQRLPCLDPCLGPERGDGGLPGEHQHVADAPGAARDLEPVLPRVVLFPELAHIADAQPLPVRLLQVRHQAVHRAHLAPVP